MFNNNYYPYQQQFPIARQNFNFLKGSPVSSLEEVKATLIDFDGTVSYFPDLANHCIYTKQINQDGMAIIQCYQLSQLPEEKKIEYVTKDEFLAAIAKIKEERYEF